MRKFLLCFLSIILVSAACDDKYQSIIPSRIVNIDCNLSYAENVSLLVAGNFKTYAKPVNATDRVGFGGVMIVHLQMPLDESTPYAAYDMACPYEVDPKIQVEPQPGGSFAICPECGSKFNIHFGTGSRQDGPATEGLRVYRINKAGNILQVRN